jgi:hypothetical protein
MAAPAPAAITAAARDMIAAEREPRPDPKSVRMPRGLLPWYEQHAEDLTASSGVKVTTNRALVIALEAYRAAVGAEAAETG